MKLIPSFVKHCCSLDPGGMESAARCWAAFLEFCYRWEQDPCDPAEFFVILSSLDGIEVEEGEVRGLRLRVWTQTPRETMGPALDGQAAPDSTTSLSARADAVMAHSRVLLEETTQLLHRTRLLMARTVQSCRVLISLTVEMQQPDAGAGPGRAVSA